MFRKKDAILLLTSYGTMALGIFLPQLAQPLRHAPVTFVMVLLLLSFLAIDMRGLLTHALKAPLATAGLLAVKAVLLPLLVYLLFHLVWPTYELAGMLVAGASTAVLAPFFANLFGADIVLTAAVVILSSLLLPFSLPPLVGILAGKSMDVGIAPMVRMLALMIFVPAILGRGCAKWMPRTTQWLLGNSYPLSLLAVGITNLGVFSRYSGFFLENPQRALEAMAAGGVMVACLMVLAVWYGRRLPLGLRSTSLVCLLFPNYILILAFSCQFFGPVEATFAATYSVPFFLQLLFIRKLGGLA
ncbi:membrane protein, putative [Syntrophotalea carbinolica DSM 2380]|uniref:Membrane protein, putative n=1 Tax=Syntrophotalea carbinolica (strain DSM 2380 / NBRC 103641 / GraBd1) TaxID=338963 RepID=Q3A720_SYNC1|nr:membrane protein [Syntrophotalea carbinolica]ABA87831.1 membrane protein, putative [Syntrophotalea carbinolica DSM 2380]